MFCEELNRQDSPRPACSRWPSLAPPATPATP